MEERNTGAVTFGYAPLPVTVLPVPVRTHTIMCVLKRRASDHSRVLPRSIGGVNKNTSHFPAPGTARHAL
ncbi:hypothetical protein EDB83DRAFT_2538503 [Lactarius deliciosus]|nr:hypothetical protein EDB83DRAFT_2538503 [Lactarius deliciosus]